MSRKRLMPAVFLRTGEAAAWFDDFTVLSRDASDLASSYDRNGADALIVIDLSDDDREHDLNTGMLKKICRRVHVPVYAGGHVRRQEDIKKILYAGARKAVIDMSSKEGAKLISEAALRFGKEKIAASVDDFDSLYKNAAAVNESASEIIFTGQPRVQSLTDITDKPTVIITDTEDENVIMNILKQEKITGLSGKYIEDPGFSFSDFKERCESLGLDVGGFSCAIDFDELCANRDGLVPVISQHFRTGEVLMLAYMNKEAFDATVKTGKMTYFSRSRNTLWVKGETSGHFQYVRSLTADCDLDTLLAKVDQVGPACHTGSRSCFFNNVMGDDLDETNPLRVFESVYATILDRKEHPKEGSYTNYLFDKGIDKILKKVGEEATELVIAAKNQNPEEVRYELSDLLYHAMVLMAECHVTWDDVTAELANR